MLRDWLELWPVWDEEDAYTFRLLVDATLPLVLLGFRLSRQLAAEYYRAFRFAEEVEDNGFSPILAPDPEDARVAGTLYRVGLEMHRDARAAGHNATKAREATLVRMSGSVTTLVLEGGRDTVIRSVAADRQARGWARIAGPNACTFCRLMAARGPVYKTAQTASFKPHDQCACGVEPAFGDYQWNARSREYSQEYSDALKWARQTGQMPSGTSNDSLNAYRRFLAQR